MTKRRAIMNSKKKGLLVASYVILFLSVVYAIYNLYNVVTSIQYYQNFEPTSDFTQEDLDYTISIFKVYAIYYLWQIVAELYCAIICLLVSINKISAQKQRKFLLSVVIVSFLSASLLAFILIILAYNTNDYYVTNSKQELATEEKETQQVVDDFADKKKDLEDLRRLKEEGIISEEEFNERLKKLL